VQCTQAFSVPNTLVRDANNEERASLFFLLDPSEGLASVRLQKNEVCRFHAAPRKGSRVMRSRAVGSGGNFQQPFSIGAEVDEAQQLQGGSATIASITWTW
jgi:hypothetical protein